LSFGGEELTEVWSSLRFEWRGSFRENSGRLQRELREASERTQGGFRENSGRLQRELKATSFKTQEEYMKNSGTIPAEFQSELP
jgi:hypothetical protein